MNSSTGVRAAKPTRSNQSKHASAAPSGFTKVDAALLLLVLIWGVNFAAIKIALLEINVLAFSIIRFSLATLIILVLVRISGESLGVPRKQWPAVIGLGIIGHTLYQLLFTYGLEATSSSHSALMLALVPIFVAIIGTVLRLDRLPPQRWAGIGLSFIGIVFVVAGGSNLAEMAILGEADGASIARDLTGNGQPNARGDLMVLGGALAWAIYTVLSKPLLAQHSPLKLTGLTMAAGTVGLTAYGWRGLLSQDWLSISPMAWALFLYAALGGLVIAYTIWFTGVQRLGGARTAVYSNLVPVVALVVGWWGMGEHIGPVQALGAILVLAGVWLTRRRRRAA